MARLIIDDEEPIRKVLEKILEDLGYDVCKAENGKEGVDIYREQHDDIDLVLLDMIMPVMDGKDCLTEMHKISPD